MRSIFKVDTDYVCSSIQGSSPTFHPTNNTDDTVWLTDVLTQVAAFIRATDGKAYRYSPGVVTFRPNSNYKVVQVIPDLIFEGEVYIPFMMLDDKLKDGEKALEELLDAYAVKSTNTHVKLLLEHYSWKISNWWDGDIETLRGYIKDDLDGFCRLYMGSHMGQPNDKIFCTVLTTTFFSKPEATAWCYLRENAKLPKDMHVVWEKDKAPKAYVGDILFVDWLKMLMGPSLQYNLNK